VLSHACAVVSSLRLNLLPSLSFSLSPSPSLGLRLNLSLLSSLSFSLSLSPSLNLRPSLSFSPGLCPRTVQQLVIACIACRCGLIAVGPYARSNTTLAVTCHPTLLDFGFIELATCSSHDFETFLFGN
jgi:hypothetical protein